MKAEQAQKLIDELSRKINHYNTQYYQLGESDIDDNEYDILMSQLVKLEKSYPQFQRSDSPSLRVGAERRGFSEGFSEGFAKNVEHGSPMLSLSNIYSKAELENWMDSLESRLSKKDNVFVCELKIDGVAISLIYEKGVFKRAATRGDGKVGEDVSNNIKTIVNLPTRLKQEVSLELRGEIFLTRQRFELLNSARAKQGKPVFKNARNAAAGAIRLKDPEETAKRGLDIFIHDIPKGYAANEHSENLKYLEELGLPINPCRDLCESSEEIMGFCRKWELEKDKLPFSIDGIVIKLNDLESRQRAGVTAKSPRWANAWKFKTERVKSRLISVENSIGRTGVLTPVANLEPVQLLGTVVKRATLHNYSQILRLGAHSQDTLFIEKGGDIIPKITGVDYSQRKENSEPLRVPEHCPACHEKLSKSDSEIDLRCANSQCPAVIKGRLEHFVSKKGMDIKSLGGSIIQRLIENKLITGVADIYSLDQKRELLLKLEGMGGKSVDNLLRAIEKSKTRALNHLIFALGIAHIGEKSARTLAERSGSIEAFWEFSEEKLEALPDFGPIMTNGLLEWLRTPENIATLKELTDLGVKPAPLALNSDQPFSGRRIVITGTLSKPRNQWKADLEKVGFQVSSSISKKTDYLLIGQKPGSKLKKASTLKVEIISEEDMLKLLTG